MALHEQNMKMLIIFVTIMAVTVAAPDKLAKKLTLTNSLFNNDTSSKCNTPTCKREASKLLDKMDLSVDPCKNFYEFACGKFIKETNNTASENGALQLAGEKIENQQLITISSEIKNDDLPVFKHMKSFYQACMDTEKIKNNVVEELKEILNELGGWPILEGSSWDDTDFTWEQLVSKSVEMGYNHNIFFDVALGTDISNISKHIMEITSDPQLGTTPGTNEKRTNAYRDLLIDIAGILGANFEMVSSDDLSNLIKFIQNLSMIINTASTGEERIQIKQLEIDNPNISWTKYLNGILAPHTVVHSNEEVVVKNPTYLKALSKLIGATSKRTLANYVLWNVIQQSIRSSAGSLIDAKKRFSARVQLPRQKVCFNDVRSYFPIAYSALFVKYNFDRSKKNATANLMENIRNSLSHMIEQADWMDSLTKARALEKLSFMRQYIGYIEEIVDDKRLNEYYKNLEVYPDSFLKFRNSLTHFINMKYLSMLKKPVYENTWLAHNGATQVNAFYTVSENSIDIGGGYIHEFFDANRPNYINYGATGWFIGHEMTHGFDTDGAKSDKDGNHNNWWEPKTKKIFEEKADCVKKQYNDYKINGYKTLGENIADGGGVKAAYHAYNRWAENNGVEPQLPDLNYTPQQMFWISVATSRCEKLTPEYREQLILEDEHPPQDFRVIASFSNSVEFAKDFECPLGSPMNPVKKCVVW